MGTKARPILIVDDNPATRYATSRVIRNAGFEVVEAATGAEALAQISPTPGLIILDVRLPDANGFQLAEEFRRIPQTMLVPLMHLSAAHVTVEDQVRGLDSGADAYLTHPVEPSVLVATVRTLLRARKAEEAYRESEAKFRSLFDHLTNYAMILDLNGRLIEANQSVTAGCGYIRENITGDFFWAGPWWRSSETIQEQIKAGFSAAKEGIGFEEELEFVLADGAKRMMDLQLTPVYDEAGNLVFVGATGSDITDRVYAERENARLYKSLQEGDQKKDQFLATLAHELRNPLAPIRSGIQLLSTQSATVSSPKLLEIMDRQMEHLVRLVDDLLDVSRITNGKIDLHISPISLKTVLDSALEASMFSIESKGHRLTVRPPDRNLVVDGDLVRLAQVFGNLLNNAAKFTPPGGDIGLGYSKSGDTVTVWVTDTGIGIPEERMEDIFDVFVQIEGQGSRYSGGLGLGLALSKMLVELHGGSIKAESVPGRTDFSVTLPISSKKLRDWDADKQPEGKIPKPLDILLIDDNSDNCGMMSAVLESDGHTVTAAASGREALRIAESFRPDIAFIDIGLPDLSGHEVARALKDKWGHQTVLVALTGYGTDTDKENSHSAGFDDHLTKPASADSIAEIITVVSGPTNTE